MSPRDACVSCHQPVGHHLLKCSRDTLQEELTEAVHEVPVEPLKAPPKAVQSFPGDRTKFQLMPLPLAPVKFSFRLNKVAKMKTGPPSPKGQMLDAITITPQVTIHKLMPERYSPSLHQFSLPPPLKLKKKISNSKLKNKEHYQPEKEKLHQAERKNSINLPWNTTAAEKKISITPPPCHKAEIKDSSTYMQEQDVLTIQTIKSSEIFMNLQGP